MVSLIRHLWHGKLHGSVWRTITSRRPTYAQGALYECECGARWLSRAPWDRQAGF